MFDLSIYFLLGLLIIVYEFSRKKYFIIDHITMFNFFFFLVYAFTPIALTIYGTNLIADDMPYGHHYYGKNPFTSTIVFASYLFFLAGYHLVFQQKTKYNLKFETIFSTKIVIRFLPFAYLFLFAVMYLYTSEFGGLFQSIELAKAYRSGDILYHKFGFVQHFFPLNGILLYYLYYKVVLEKNREYRFVLSMFFLLSIGLALLIMALYSSRGYIIFEIAGLYVITAIYYKNYFLKYLIPAIILAYAIIKFGHPLTNSLSDLVKYGFDTFWGGFLERVKVMDEAGKSIISNFTHPMVSLEASLAHSGVDIPYRYFQDIINAFISLLPAQLLGLKNPQMLMELNTLILQGREVEQILPGILGFFSYSFNVVGVFVGSFIYGLMGGYLYKLFIAFYQAKKVSIIYIYFIALTYGYFVFRGTPSATLIEKFMLLVVIFTILFFSKIVISNKKEAS